MFTFNKPSLKALCALVLYIALSVLSERWEDPVITIVADTCERLFHLNFHTLFGPRPAISVNGLTITLLVRSVSTLCITWLALRISRRSWNRIGFEKRNFSARFLTGLCVGFLSICFLMAALRISHVLIFDGRRLQGTDIFDYGARWLFGLLLVGFAEECRFRSFAMYSLAEIFGYLPAILLTSLAFAFAHTGHPGENLLGLIQTFLFGVLCATNIFRTRSIWWAVGFHGMWDWTQEYFFGTLGSSMWFDGHLFQFRPQGNSVLSGGSVGPEGSICSLFVLGLLLSHELMQLRKRLT